MVNEELIKEFIQSELVSDRTDDELLNTDNLIASGIIDSLGIIKLIGYLEKTYFNNIISG
jgi:acyl carrier protein